MVNPECAAEDVAMGSGSHRTTVLRFFTEVVGQGNLDVLDEISTEDYDDHVALPGQAAGRAGLKQRIATIRAAFAPRHILHDILVDGELVAVRWTLHGTHAGPFLGLPATGREIVFDGVDIYRMRDGRMCAHWNVVDLLAFHQQVTF